MFFYAFKTGALFVFFRRLKAFLKFVVIEVCIKNAPFILFLNKGGGCFPVFRKRVFVCLHKSIKQVLFFFKRFFSFLQMSFCLVHKIKNRLGNLFGKRGIFGTQFPQGFIRENIFYDGSKGVSHLNRLFFQVFYNYFELLCFQFLFYLFL